MGRPPIGKTAMTGAERQRRYWLNQRVANKPVPNPGADNATIAALQEELATAVRYRDLAQEFVQTMQQLATARARIAELEKAWSDLSSELPSIPYRKNLPTPGRPRSAGNGVLGSWPATPSPCTRIGIENFRVGRSFAHQQR